MSSSEESKKCHQCDKHCKKSCDFKVSSQTQINDPSGYPFPIDNCTLAYPVVSNSGPFSPPFEPYITVHPCNPKILAASWLLGKEQPVAITFDGGKTWINTLVPLSACLGGLFNQIIDGSWLQITKQDTVIRTDLFAVIIDLNTPVIIGASVTVGKICTKKGIIWEQAQIVFQAPIGSNYFSAETKNIYNLILPTDKQVVLADPCNNHLVYYMWHAGARSLTVNKVTSPVFLARSVNGGETWETSKIVYDPAMDSSLNPTQGLAFATLSLDLKKLISTNKLIFLQLLGVQLSPTNVRFFNAIITSKDNGSTWSHTAT